MFINLSPNRRVKPLIRHFKLIALFPVCLPFACRHLVCLFLVRCPLRRQEQDGRYALLSNKIGTGANDRFRLNHILTMPLKYTVKKRGNKAKMREQPISLNRANGLLWLWVFSTGRKLAVKGGCILHFHDEVSVGHERHTQQTHALPVVTAKTKFQRKSCIPCKRLYCQ